MSQRKFDLRGELLNMTKQRKFISVKHDKKKGVYQGCTVKRDNEIGCFSEIVLVTFDSVYVLDY